MENDKMEIEFHIDKKQQERDQWLKTWIWIEKLNESVGLKPDTYSELNAKLSSKIAQCDISIRNHKDLLK